MVTHNLSPNFEDRFSKIELQTNQINRKLNHGTVTPNVKKFPHKDGGLTIPKNPILSTSKRAENRGISRSGSSNNLSSTLHISKTPSRNAHATVKSLSTAKKTNKRVLSSNLPSEPKSVGNTPYNSRPEMSYMRDTSSSMRKMSNPFNSNASPFTKSSQSQTISKSTVTTKFPNMIPSTGPRRVVSNVNQPSDITNLNYEKTRKPDQPPLSPSKRNVSQPFTNSAKMDVYTRLYNDSKARIPSNSHSSHNQPSNHPQNHVYPEPHLSYNQLPYDHHQPLPPPPPISQEYPSTMKVDHLGKLRRSSGSLELEKSIIKVESLVELLQIIYDEDPNLFEDTNQSDFYSNDPRLPQEFQQEDTQDQNPLDIYERGEILRRKDIYFIPSESEQTQRRINIRNYSNNYGFDDQSGNYVVVPKDHINYRYQILSVLGNGSFGNVVKCIDKKFSDKTNNNKVVAIKIIKNDLNWSLQAIYEIKMLKHLNGNRPIINSNNPYMNEYGDYDCPVLTYFNHFHFRGHMCIVTEPLSINLYSLLEIIKFKGLSLSLIQVFFKKILRGLEFIHSKNVLHCDIKPENIMIKVPSTFEPNDITEESLIIKIVDFGTSCFANEISYSYIQSRFYRAPEVIIGAKYDKMIDIWSIGCIIAELFTGDPLLPGKNELEQIGLILEIFGGPSSSLILHQRNQLLRSIKERKSTNKFDDKLAQNPNILQVGLADEKSIKKTLLYTLFDMEGKINMQFLNMRINAASTMSNHPSFHQRKTFKISSRNLEVRLKLRSCNEDKRSAMLFMKFLNKIFKWDPEERSDATQLLNDPFLNI